MALTTLAAVWFAIFAVPICVYICFTDMKGMKIPNHAVVALFVVFALVGPFVLPLDTYFWRYLHMVVVLVAGVFLNAGGAMGAGDAKFAAAAAPMIALGDVRFLMALFAANLLAAFVTHRIGKYTPLRRLAPDWISWNAGSRFPMGLALGGTLALYLLLGIFFGRPTV